MSTRAFRIRCLHLALAISVLASPFAALSSSLADVIELHDGGQVEGTLVERGPHGEYVVQTKTGARITFSEKQVRRFEAEDKLLSEYFARSRAQPDTLEAHRELVSWCREQRLTKLVDHHLQRILELDPQDEQARRGLGFQRVGGEWLTRNQIMTRRGLVFFDGAYRTPQDASLRQRAESRKQAEAEWHRKLKLWRGWLYGRRESRADEAFDQIAAILDPHATPAIVKFLHSEDDPEIRDLLLSTLAKLDHSLAVRTLVDLSLEDPDPEMRFVCIEHLLETDRPLSLFPYISTLSSSKSSNLMINRAGEALQTIGNPEAISPLIDALVTTHKYATGEDSPDRINTSFTPQGGGGGGGGGTGGGGFSFGSGPQFELRNRRNSAVHRALVELSEQDFQYDIRAWRRWFVNSQSRGPVGARRDD